MPKQKNLFSHSKAADVPFAIFDVFQPNYYSFLQCNWSRII